MDSMSPYVAGESDDEMPLLSAPMSEQHMPGSGAGSGFSIREALGNLFSSSKKDAAAHTTGSHRVHLGKSAAQKIDAGTLARTQSADGSFGGDVGRTAAALLVLLLLGHTRQKGDRRRTVQKAASWLLANISDVRAARALAALDNAEAGTLSPNPNWHSMFGEGDEGKMLQELL